MTLWQTAGAAALMVPTVTFLSWRTGVARIPVGAVAITLLSAVAGAPGLAAIGGAAAWTAWALHPARSWGDTEDPETGADILATLARHGLAGLLLFPYWHAWPFLAPAALLFTLWSTLGAAERTAARWTKGKNIGARVEAFQGLGYALLLAGALIARRLYAYG